MKTEQLRKQIGFIITDYTDDILNSTRCGGIFTLPENIKEFVIKNILEACKKAGGVLLSDNQELPKNPYDYDDECNLHYGYSQAQQDMKDFKRVEEIEV